MNNWRDLIRKWWPIALPVSVAVAVFANLGDAYETCANLYDWLLKNYAPDAWSPLMRGRVFHTFFIALMVLVLALVVAALSRVVRGGLEGRGSAARPRQRGKVVEAARRNYLDYLEKDISNRLKSSIHFARFIDIGLQENFNATAPWHYVAFGEAEQRFEAFDEALEHYRRRVLLLGPPGSGKTTTLLNTALKLVREARENPLAPLPLLFNLSTFDELPQKKLLPRLALSRSKAADEERGEEAFERWLVRQMTGLVVEDLTKDVARRWVEGGRVALLLDGLDEVDENKLKSLVALMNSTYFRVHPSQPVIVCSRVIEYQPLQDSPGTRLNLEGAVTLQPLGREQINAYLEAARATALRDALLTDEVLYEMAQTPLTLSMMTLAYGDEVPADATRALSFLQRRRQLLDTYVERMVQREARRRAGVFYDSNPDKDVPPRYPLRRTQHYLGWLAVRLSERMRTLLPLARLHSFLNTPSPQERRFPLGIADAAQFIVVLLTVLLMNLSLADAHGASGWEVLAVTTAVAPLIPLVSKFFAWPMSGSSAESEHVVVLVIGGVLVVCLYLCFCFSMVSQSLVSVLAIHTDMPFIRDRLRLSDETFSPGMAGQIVAGFILGSLILCAVVAQAPKREGRGRPFGRVTGLVALTGIAAAAAALVYALTGSYQHAWLGVAAGCALGTFILLRVKALHGMKFLEYALSFILYAWMGAFLLPSLNALVGPPSLNKLVIMSSLAVGLICCLEEGAGVAVGVAAAAVVGNLLGGPALAVIFSAAAFVVLLPLKSRAQTAAETFLLNPALRLLLALRGDICLRYQAFLDYSVQAMLLKHVGAEYEFIHRLLRDHFAIRELIPALEGAKGEERLAVIDRLSRQGESSVEALTNLATHEDNGVRRAAVEGLGRTATPANLSVLTRTFKEDTSADVRGAVVRSLRRFSYGQASEILTLAIEDVAPEVRREVVASLQDSRFGFMSLQSGEFVTIIEKALSDKSEAVFRQGLTAIDKQHYKADKFSDFFRSNPTALTRLREAARSDAPEVRRAALRLMGYTQSPLCLPDLADALRDRDVGVRKAAVGGLSTLGLKEAVPLLLAALKDRKRSIRAQAVVALGGFGSAGLSTEMEEAVVAALRKAIGGWFMPSAAAADALGNFGGGKAIEVLKAAARHSSNDDVRQAAVKSLGKLCVKSAVPVLMHALRDKHCRADAARALGLIDDRSVIPTLLAWLDGGTRLRIPAVMTLAELKATEALSRLERLAGEPPRATLRVLRWFPGTALRDVRPYALVALGMLGDAGVLPTILGFATQAGERLAWAKTKALLCLRAEDTGEKFAELYDAASPAHQRQLAEIIANLHMVFRASGSAENDRAATSILNKVGERVSDKTGAVEQTRPRISRHKVYALFEHDASFFTV